MKPDRKLVQYFVEAIADSEDAARSVGRPIEPGWRAVDYTVEGMPGAWRVVVEYRPWIKFWGLIAYGDIGSVSAGFVMATDAAEAVEKMRSIFLLKSRGTRVIQQIVVSPEDHPDNDWENG